MTIVATVKRIVAEAAKGIPDAEVVAPLPVWDGQHGSMGVQIKAPQSRGVQRCEVTANFVLTARELTEHAYIKLKAVTAVNAIRQDVQVVIRLVKAAPSERLAAAARAG